MPNLRVDSVTIIMATFKPGNGEVFPGAVFITQAQIAADCYSASRLETGQTYDAKQPTHFCQLTAPRLHCGARVAQLESCR